MNKNIIMRLLTSIPVICIFLYFIPFLGIILTILRKFIHTSKKYSTSVFLIVFSIVLLIPKAFEIVLNLFSFELPYLNDIVNSNV